MRNPPGPWRLHGPWSARCLHELTLFFVFGVLPGLAGMGALRGAPPLLPGVVAALVLVLIAALPSPARGQIFSSLANNDILRPLRLVSTDEGSQ